MDNELVNTITEKIKDYRFKGWIQSNYEVLNNIYNDWFLPLSSFLKNTKISDDYSTVFFRDPTEEDFLIFFYKLSVPSFNIHIPDRND